MSDVISIDYYRDNIPYTYKIISETQDTGIIKPGIGCYYVITHQQPAFSRLINNYNVSWRCLFIFYLIFFAVCGLWCF